MARGARARGKRIAFGDGQQIKWDHHSAAIFQDNPNIAQPGSENDSDLEWIPFYRGHRIYNTELAGKWGWNYEFRPIPGEMFLTDEERQWAEKYGKDFILIEPNVPTKSVAVNKQWDVRRYDKVARYLHKDGHDIRQFIYRGYKHRVPLSKTIPTPSFRHALAVMERAKLYIGPEGGLHHGAAAMGTRAVVIFGGFIPPEVTGYDTHINISANGKACGSFRNCSHCRVAMESISVDRVHKAALSMLEQPVPAWKPPSSWGVRHI